ncbi:alpha/beta hydrolase-fold protein [Spirillospora sp. NPDC050679]
MIAGPPRLPRPAPAERAASPRLAALAAAVHDGRAGAEEEFWAEADAHGGPLVEPIPGDGDHLAVTFLWRGDDDTAQVIAMVNRLFDPLDPAGSLMRRVPGTRVWHITYRLGRDHSGSYRIAAGPAENDSPESLKRLAATRAGHDPRNPWSVPLRWDDSARASVFELPDAPAPPWRPWRTPPSPGTASQGTVTRERIRSAALGDEREVWLYRPPAPLPNGPLDTLLLLDGDMWFGKCGVQALFDRLIADGAIPPLAVVSPHAVSTAARMAEYGGNPAHTEFLTSELMPWAAERLPLTGDPARTAIAGESLGGLTALHVGFEAPGRFGLVLAQSASLWWNPDGAPPATAPADAWLTGRYARSPRRDLRVHLRVGRHEWALADQNRELHRTLRTKGYPAAYTEYNGGHDYVCWTDGLAAGLADLFGDLKAAMAK